jgi:hypothetical protein
MKYLRILLALTAASFTHAKANLVISEIDLVANKVEIVNTGSSTVNMAGYQWCNLWKGSPAYVALATSQIVAAQSTATTLNLPAGGVLTFQLTAGFITDLQGELGLYTTNSFGTSTAIVDYVSWGGDAVRDAVAAGKVPPIWTTATFVAITAADITAGRSIQLGAGLAGNGFADYSLAAPTLGVNQVTPAPVVTTGSASAITANTATLSGTVNAKGASTTVTFQYGETLSYGSSIAASPSPVTGSTDTAVSANLASLLPGTTYNFRVVGTSANGTTLGDNQTFTTTATPPDVIVLTNTGVSRSGNILTVNFSGPPNVLSSAWQVVGSTTLASFPDNKTADTTFSENPAGSGNYQALIDVTGEPPTYFVRIVLP